MLYYAETTMHVSNSDELVTDDDFTNSIFKNLAVNICVRWWVKFVAAAEVDTHQKSSYMVSSIPVTTVTTSDIWDSAHSSTSIFSNWYPITSIPVITYSKESSNINY